MIYAGFDPEWSLSIVGRHIQDKIKRQEKSNEDDQRSRGQQSELKGVYQPGWFIGGCWIWYIWFIALQNIWPRIKQKKTNKKLDKIFQTYFGSGSILFRNPTARLAQVVQSWGFCQFLSIFVKAAGGQWCHFSGATRLNLSSLSINQKWVSITSHLENWDLGSLECGFLQINVSTYSIQQPERELGRSPRCPGAAP